MHEPPDAACGLRIFGNIGGGFRVWRIALFTEATPESAAAAHLSGSQDVRVLAVAHPGGGLHPAGACRTVPHEKLPKRPHAASAYGVALERRWIPYGPSEQSKWAPQLGQRSWQACMSIIWHPHMGHSFLLPAAIHHAPGSAPYYSCRQARCLRQLPSGQCTYLRQGHRLSGSQMHTVTTTPGSRTKICTKCNFL